MQWHLVMQPEKWFTLQNWPYNIVQFSENSSSFKSVSTLVICLLVCFIDHTFLKTQFSIYFLVRGSVAILICMLLYWTSYQTCLVLNKFYDKILWRVWTLLVMQLIMMLFILLSELIIYLQNILSILELQLSRLFEALCIDHFCEASIKNQEITFLKQPLFFQAF